MQNNTVKTHKTFEVLSINMFTINKMKSHKYQHLISFPPEWIYIHSLHIRKYIRI